MAARRLIAILLVLLFLSSLAAALAPVPEQTGTESSTTGSSTTTADAPTLPDPETGDARVVTQKVDASAPRPVLIRVRVGDRLRLKVTSQRPGTVELVDLGPTEDVGPNQPAFFDVLLREEGSHPVQFLDTERDIAQIEVSPPRTPPATR